MSLAYEKAPGKIDEVLKLIAKVAAGRKLLESFLPMLAKGTVRIEAYPDEIVAKLREILPSDQPIGACFTVDPETRVGCIYLDYGSPLGVLAPFLVHEIVHSLDPKVWKGDAQKSRERMLETEEHAFHSQFLFTEELRDRDPDYDRFLRTVFPKAKILHELLEPSEIEALYASDGKKVA